MTRRFVFLLLACTDELISTPIITTFLPNAPLGCEKFPFPSNPIPYPVYLYSSILEALIIYLHEINNSQLLDYCLQH